MLATFGPITKLHLEVSHFTPSKLARNNLVFHGRHAWAHESLFSICFHCGSLGAFSLASSGIIPPHQRVHLTQLTPSSMYA